jgi:OOP family OmpA-OmpF porin
MTIPSDMHLNSSLRTFGHGDCMSSKETTLKLYGIQPHTQAGFAEALDNVVCVGGDSPLTDALMAVTEDLNAAMGRTAVIIVSDGEDMGNTPLEAAQKLAETHSDTCVYPVLIGNDKAGETLMEELSQVTDCGHMSKYSDIYSPDGMAQFVKYVFYGEKYIPPKPEPKPEPAPMDSDGDGVFDENDRCPGTPYGATVDQYGCWTIANILFDFDKSTIRPQFHSLLHEVVRVFEKNPGLKVEIQGHTCNMGPAAYNQKLSERRAQSVYDYLIDQGVDSAQLKTVGFGLDRPIASNATRDGRVRNRRVEFHPVK